MVDRQIHEALEMARHDLVSLNGLIAADGKAPKETFKIDNRRTLRKIDAAMKAAKLRPIRINPKGK